jgi:hypothetical protein
MNTIKKYLAPIGLFFLAIIAVLRYFIPGKAETNPFPGAAEKKAAEKAVEDTKDEIKELEDKQYADVEIEKKFNDV